MRKELEQVEDTRGGLCCGWDTLAYIAGSSRSLIMGRRRESGNNSDGTGNYAELLRREIFARVLSCPNPRAMAGSKIRISYTQCAAGHKRTPRG